MNSIMKKLFLSAVASVVILTGCNTTPEDPAPSKGGNTKTGYLSVRLTNGSQTPKDTKAPGTNDGSAEESKVGSLMALLFNNGICVDVIEVSGGTIGNSGTAGTASDAVLVNASSTHAMIVANPEKAAWGDLKIDFSATDMTTEKTKVVGKSWVAINQLVPMAVTGVATDNFFTMANAGSLTNGALVPVTVVAADNGKTDEQAKTEAKQKAAQINIDRLSSKVTFDINDNLSVVPQGAAFTFGGWELNVTNKSSYLYSDLVELTDANATGEYRRDGNYDLKKFPGIEKEASDRTSAEIAALSVALRKEFNVLLNSDGNSVPTSPVVRAKSASAYCLENTMEAPAQKKGVTTSIVIKAQYTPKEVKEANETNYFIWNRQYYTLAQLKTAYATAAAADHSKGIAKDLPNFLRAAKVTGVEAATTDALMDTFVANLTAASFNAESGIVGRYMAVQYFHNSVCYYEVLVRHDQGITTKMALGRYGVVRNNWYTVNLRSVSGPGTPWIPDPTDPVDPTDPTKPIDPTTPTDPGTNDDADNSYLSVAITVRPWTTWSYEVDI